MKKGAQTSHMKMDIRLRRQLALLLLLTQWSTIVNTDTGGQQDYCESDVFRANCPYSEVVVIEEAIYGRMKLGTCLKMDTGFMGCQRDIRPVLDKLCSGRASCDIEVRDLILERNPCPSDLRSYLHVKYTCLPVLTPSENCCTFHGDHVRLEATRGVLASMITDITGCGAYECPWILTAQQGQGFNFTLHDYSAFVENTNISDGSVDIGKEKICTIYATIKDESSSNVVTLCNGNERITRVYTSESNIVEIRILAHQGRFQPFLIEYEVFGCPDPIPPSNGNIERTNDGALIRCIHGSDITWNITCVDGQWDGYVGNCTLHAPEVLHAIERPVNAVFDKAGPVLIIVMIIVVAIILSIAIMAVGITYLKKQPRGRHNLDRRYHRSSLYSHRDPQHDSFKSGANTIPAKAIYIRKSGISSNMPWQYTRPLPQPGNYESELHAYKRPENIKDHEVKYYVLDPDISALHGNNEVSVF